MDKKYHYTGGGANRSVEEIERLKNKYDEFKIDYIYDIFEKIFNLKVSKIQRPQNIGLPHISYVVSFANHKDLFYRGNLGWDKPELELLKEKIISDIALKNNIPSNKIIYTDISRNTYPFDFQIQEIIEGLDAEKVFNGSEDDYGKYSFSIGQNIAKLSKIQLQNFGHFISEGLLSNNLVGENSSFFDYIFLQLSEQIELIAKSKFITTNTAQKIIDLFESNKKIINDCSNSLVHYDLADHNLRYDPKTYEVVAIYDWEASVAGDSLLDLASSPSWKSIYPRKDKLREGFLSIVEKPNHFELKLDLYLLRTIIWKIEHNIKFDMATPERIKRLSNALEPFGLKTEI